MNGNDFLIYLNGLPIAATKSNEMATHCEAIEVSGPTTGSWREFIAGKKEWQANASFLVTNAIDIGKLIEVGRTYTLAFRTRTGANTVSGQAICTECRITATRGTLIQGSFQFKGTGELK